MHLNDNREEEHFLYQKIDCYPNFLREDIPVLLNRDYERFIFDFGDQYVNYREEILRCDKKVFLLNLNPWQNFAAEKLVSTVQNTDWGGIRPVYASISFAESEKKKIEKRYHIQISQVPLIQEPFCIVPTEFLYLDMILNSNAPNTKRKKLQIHLKRKK